MTSKFIMSIIGTLARLVLSGILGALVLRMAGATITFGEMVQAGLVGALMMELAILNAKVATKGSPK